MSAPTEFLVNLLSLPGVSRPEAVHGHDCRYWRQGKSHGPCLCGARHLDACIRAALIAVGVNVPESPNEIHERESLAAAGSICSGKLLRADDAWICVVCGWKKDIPK